MVHVASAGKRSAVRQKSGELVANSSPVLKGPTSPDTAGRIPEACPSVLWGCAAPPSLQPQSWPGAGAGSPEKIARERASASGPPTEKSVGREAPALDGVSIPRLRQFFEMLDQWDREAHEPKTM
jgi:hypothetical protein